MLLRHFIALIFVSTVLASLDQRCADVNLDTQGKCFYPLQSDVAMNMKIPVIGWHQFDIELVQSRFQRITINFIKSERHLMVIATKASDILIIPPAFLCSCLSSIDMLNILIALEEGKLTLGIMWRNYEKLIKLGSKETHDNNTIMLITNKGRNDMKVHVFNSDRMNKTQNVDATDADEDSCPDCQYENHDLSIPWQNVLLLIELIAFLVSTTCACYLYRELRAERSVICQTARREKAVVIQRPPPKKSPPLPKRNPRKTSDVNHETQHANAPIPEISNWNLPADAEHYEDPFTASDTSPMPPRIAAPFPPKSTPPLRPNPYIQDKQRDAITGSLDSASTSPHSHIGSDLNVEKESSAYYDEDDIYEEI